jgi:hypothetical protein
LITERSRAGVKAALRRRAAGVKFCVDEFASVVDLSVR